MARVTELVLVVTVFPAASWIFTTGCEPKAMLLAAPVGWVVNASLAAGPAVIQATFSEAPGFSRSATFNITVTNGANGSISPGTTAVTYGTNKTFTITERFKVKAEGTFTNVLNHTNLQRFASHRRSDEHRDRRVIGDERSPVMSNCVEHVGVVDAER